MFVPVIPSPPSPQAQELGRQLAEHIREYRSSHPDLRGAEIGQAILVARQQLSQEGVDSRSKALVMALLLGLFALGAVAFLYVGGDLGTSMPMIVIAIAILATLLGFVAVR